MYWLFWLKFFDVICKKNKYIRNLFCIYNKNIDLQFVGKNV